MPDPAITTTRFASLPEKAQWMDGAASLDAEDPHVRALARVLTIGATSTREAATRLHRWVRDRLWYSHDPFGIEFTPDSRVTIEAGTEDCDGKARALVALVRALRNPRLQARLRALMPHADSFAHVQAEISCDDGPWTLAETILRGVELGDDPRKGRDAAGRFDVI